MILSGKEVSASVYDSLDQKIKSLRKNNITPGLAVVLVGEDSASQVYVRSKTKTFNKLSLFTKTYRLPSASSESRSIIYRETTFYPMYPKRYHGNIKIL
ncbi:MAG: tetrahydrofolate dehydrogenase/cyclohydrolase catalytic domain-containing protein [Candidatus Neomarinimicrobiota bacterium]